MSEAAVPPLGIRLMSALGKEPDWDAMSAEDLVTFREKVNRKRSSRLARLVTGRPDRAVHIQWQQAKLADRELPVRVYRPTSDPGSLPLVVHVHGGGFVGTAVQSDWINSHLAAQLPAVVVSVEHRLLAPDSPLQAAVDDGWDVLQHVLQHAAEWRIDPARIALFGESTGGIIAALVAIRARDTGLSLRAQVLANPAVDLTETMFDYASMTQHADSPTLTLAQMHFFHRLAVPTGADPRPLSPLYADNLAELAPALVVVPTLDPLADHGRRYAERLRDSGTPTQLAEHPGATHAFLSMPGLVPQAKPARTQITTFLTNHLDAASTGARLPAVRSWLRDDHCR